ncbi:hypothetical protein AcV5_005742 [Taiwanofungus camphoratus]|nr:hypothetical protein AcV5_005742 [Antrodia cinnamomea]KAI0933651.1 hypothetical protein AcV5_005742 [Antrodia cinnamomea]
MSGRCEECGDSTIWDQELGSAICTHCGTLADPTQSVLTSHLEHTDTSGREFFWNTVQGGTLKGRNGWALSGQGKEVRDRRNTIAMHEFIKSVATRLSHTGLSSRAQSIFDQAMSKAQYRWGRKAKLAAGASIAIAFRESHKGDSIRDIAYLLDEPPISLSRAFTSVIAVLGLSLTSVDATVHLPALQTHLLSLVQGPHGSTPPLPTKLTATLTPLLIHLPTIMRTASSLSALISRTSILSHVPTPPTACALFILALEAELLASLPHAGALAQALGARVGTGKGVVMQRYKIVYNLVEEWIREVPWLEAHERKKGGTGRSKVAKRVVVARGLKDVVQFQEQIWSKKLESQTRPRVELELDSSQEEKGNERDEDDSGSEGGSEAGTLNVPLHPSRKEDINFALFRKKRKTRHEMSIAQASHFLLNPTASAASTGSASSRLPDNSGTAAPDLITHLLTADASSLSHAFAQAPTRLQLLAASRGGAEEANIPDEELFADGELESMLRSPEEADVLRAVMEWGAEDEEDEISTRDKVQEGGKKRKRKSDNEMDELGEGCSQVFGPVKCKEKIRGSKRINMDALARILDPSSSVEEEGEEMGSDKEDSVPYTFEEGEEVVEEWRPLSPGCAGFDEDRYDI